MINYSHFSGELFLTSTLRSLIIFFSCSVVRPIEERKSPCQSSEINVTGNPEQTVNLTTQKADFDNVPEDNNDHSVALHEILPFDSQRVEVMPTPELENDDYMVPSMISAVPDPACIWKYVSYLLVFLLSSGFIFVHLI